MDVQTLLAKLPRLGVGISAEFDSARRGIDAVRFRESNPEIVHFMEFGADLMRGLDEHVYRWRGLGLPITYHFLDLNLEERADLDQSWIEGASRLAAELDTPWICGDAGLWHFGPRDRGQQILLPPILTHDSALEMAETVQRVSEVLKLPCFPENPPGQIYLGDLHILDYFALVSEEASCPLLLDCSHLAMYQHAKGLEPLDGLDGFPLDRVGEIHIAGGTWADVDGLPVILDSHSPDPLTAAWEILEYVAPRAKRARALVYECEKNTVEECLANFERLNELFPKEM